MAGRSPTGSNRFRTGNCSSSKGRCTRPYIVWSIRLGSQPNGARRKRAEWPSSIPLRGQGVANLRRNGKVGRVSPPRSIWWSRWDDMRVFDKLRLRIRSVFRWRRVEAELKDEIQFHLEQLVKE